MRFTSVVRPERRAGEISDWVALVCLVLRTPPDGTRLLSGWCARALALLCGASAVTLGSAVLFSAQGWREVDRVSDQGLILLAHELVHVRQYREYGLVSFLWRYGREYAAGRFRGRSHDQAYRGISFEKEARRGEDVARRLLNGNALLRGGLESTRSA